MNGITYFKLMSPKYGDDKTKGCALTGAEVDANFNFLRGYDIESIELVGQSGIEFKRVNGDTKIIDLMDEEVRENVQRLNDEVAELQSEVAIVQETTESNTHAIENQEQRVSLLEETTSSLVTASTDYQQRISDLERLVREQREDIERLENKVFELEENERHLDQRIKNVRADAGDLSHKFLFRSYSAFPSAPRSWILLTAKSRTALIASRMKMSTAKISREVSNTLSRNE